MPAKKAFLPIIKGREKIFIENDEEAKEKVGSGYAPRKKIDVLGCRRGKGYRNRKRKGSIARPGRMTREESEPGLAGGATIYIEEGMRGQVK